MSSGSVKVSKLSIVVEALNLTKSFDGFLAVDKISFKIYEREIFGLLGPNGAGKTTTLLMLTTVIKPTSGSAKIYGYDIRNKPGKVREIVGIAFQDPKLYWVQTPWNILVWHGMVCGLSRSSARQRVEDVLKLLDMWDARRKRAHELSGGMKKRVEVAKLLIQRPRIAIFDEPTSQIDVSGKHVIWEAIRTMRDEGSTIILATNDLSEADRLSDRVCIMHRGRIVALDTPWRLKDSIVGGDILEVEVLDEAPGKMIPEIKSIENVVEVVDLKRKLKVYLNKGEETAPKIVNLLLTKGVKVSSIKMSEPSLDEVFIRYTGLSIKDAEMKLRNER